MNSIPGNVLYSSKSSENGETSGVSKSEPMFVYCSVTRSTPRSATGIYRPHLMLASRTPDLTSHDTYITRSIQERRCRFATAASIRRTKKWATTYSPTESTPQYHRRWRAKLLCSEWEEVYPRRHRHPFKKAASIRLYG